MYSCNHCCFSSLCGIFSRKTTSDEQTNQENKTINNSEENKNNVSLSPDHFPKKQQIDDVNNSPGDDYLKRPLQLPPARSHYRSESFATARSESLAMDRTGGGGGGGVGGLSLKSSMSMRASFKDGIGNGLLSVIDKKTKNKKLQHEDSLWKKPIILGDKCKVEDEDEDNITCDKNGNRISAYHKKVPGSRTLSFIDPDAVQVATDINKM